MEMKKDKLLKMIREEVQNVLIEMEGDEAFDSRYFRNHLDYFINSDFTSDDEKAYLDMLKALLNQRHPDGDITKEDIFELSRSLDMREYSNKVDYHTLINQIWKEI